MIIIIVIKSKTISQVLPHLKKESVYEEEKKKKKKRRKEKEKDKREEKKKTKKETQETGRSEPSVVWQPHSIV